MRVKRIFGRLWWLFHALKKSRRIKTYAQEKELDNKSRVAILELYITQLEKKLAEQEARHTEQRNAGWQYHQTNVDNCRKLNEAKKQMDAQQAQREEKLNAREEKLNAQEQRLLALQEELLKHPAVHTVPERSPTPAIQ